MRHFLRHPTDIPLRYRLIDGRHNGCESLLNVGQGGLCFRTSCPLDTGTELHLTIELQEPPFEADGVVAWCRAVHGHYEVGVQFRDAGTDFAVRMVEQACQIELYKERVLREEGRLLSGEEAAREWIGRYAERFPE